MANEADILSGKTKARADRESRGATPIRKRAFHRALKCGDEWATSIDRRNRLWRNISFNYNELLNKEMLFLSGGFWRKEQADDLLAVQSKVVKMGDVLNIRVPKKED